MKNKISEEVNKTLKKEYKIRLTSSQLNKITNISQIILAVVATAGVVSLAAVAPNIFIALDSANKLRKKFNALPFDKKQAKLQHSFYYLRKSGVVKFKNDKTGFRLFLSKKGKKLWDKFQFRSMEVKKPKMWDRKWWLVAADIPTKHYRLGADQLRQKVKDMGFYFLQRTLWLYPYDPRKEIEFIAITYGVEKFLTVMEVNRLDSEDESKLKHFFNL